MTSYFLLRCVAAARLVSLLSRVTSRTLHFAIVVLLTPELACNNKISFEFIVFKSEINAFLLRIKKLRFTFAP